MSEKRRPDAVITVSIGSAKHKIELFSASQFIDRMSKVNFYHVDQPSLALNPIDMEGKSFVRVRHNGAWVPDGRREMYPLHRVGQLISDYLRKSMEVIQ